MKFLFKNLNVLLSTVTLVISALRRYKLEDQEFEVTLSYIGSLRPVWATRDLISRVFFKAIFSFLKKGIKIQVWWHRPLVLALGSQKREDLCGFEASLVYIASSRTARTVT